MKETTVKQFLKSKGFDYKKTAIAAYKQSGCFVIHDEPVDVVALMEEFAKIPQPSKKIKNDL